MQIALQFFGLAITLILAFASPGPDFLAVTYHALANRRMGLGVAIGVSVACSVWAALAVFGVGLLIVQETWLYLGLQLIGSLYLTYLGYGLIMAFRSAHAPLPSEGQGVGHIGQALWRGFFINITNPKAVLFFSSLFVATLPLNMSMKIKMSVVVLVAVLAGLWFTALAMLFSNPAIRQVYERSRKIIDLCMGAILIAIALNLLVNLMIA